MADWDRSDVFSLTPSMYPPEFMWAGEDGTYDLEEEKAELRKHYNRAVETLNGGEGYGALKGMKERLDAHHSRAEQAESRYKSRRNYARLQFGLMKQKVVSIAREQVEGEDDEAVEEEANQILNKPMGAHWRTDEGEVVMNGGLDAVWVVMASGFNPDERWADGKIPMSDVNIHFRPERSDFATDFDEDHLHSTDKRTFDGDVTWRDALDSIHQRWRHLEEQHERAMNTRELLRFRKAVAETVLYRFEAFGSVEEMTDEEAGEIARDQRNGSPPITGYRGVEYAIEAKEILENNPITTFSGLEREMEEPTVGGGSKVDTVKRNIGYEDLPTEEKEFSQFRELLTNKVRQLKGEA